MNDSVTFAPHEFLQNEPFHAIPILVVLGIGTVFGTLGNILILIAVATRRNLQNTESILIVNLACSDLYVTAIADPMSIVAKLEGFDFFTHYPGLCQAIGSLCTISCVTSLMTIAAMSCNRYIYIVHGKYYSTIFKPLHCCILCVSFYCIGLCLVLLNQADIGHHTFDHKSLECIWDRMATYPYTVVFSIVLVWIPIVVTGLSYVLIFRHVRHVTGRVHKSRAVSPGKQTKTPSGYRLARTLFIIYVVFSVCWIPYALIIVLDSQDSYHYAVHVYIVVFAHLHPSINWLVYYFTHRKFHEAFLQILHLKGCVRQDMTSSSSSGSHVPLSDVSRSREDKSSTS